MVRKRGKEFLYEWRASDTLAHSKATRSMDKVSKNVRTAQFTRDAGITIFTMAKGL